MNGVIKGVFLFLVVAVLGAAATAYYFYDQLAQYEKISNDKLLFLEGNVASLKTRVAKQKNLIETLKTAGLDVSKNNDRIDSVTTISSTIKTKNIKGSKAPLEKEKYKFYELKFSDGPPIGYVMVFKDGSYVSKIYDHEILVNSVVGRDKGTGKIKSYANVNLVLKKSGLANRKDSRLKNWKDKPYPLKITQGETIVDRKVAGVKRFGIKIIPSLNGTVQVNKRGKFEAVPSVGASIAYYGNKDSPDWKFVNTSIGYKDRGFVQVTPVMKKIFGRNTYVGPTISIDDNADLKFGASLSLNF